MNTHADKTQKNKSQAVSAVDSQMQSGGESTFQFVDNRPEAVAQRKLQEMANNSSQVSQLRAFQVMANNSPQTKQVVQLQVMDSWVSAPEIIQRFEDEDEGRKNSRQNFAERHQAEIDQSAAGQAAINARTPGSLKPTGFDGRAASKVNASIRQRGEQIEAESAPVQGPMTESESTHLKTKDNTDLGEDLNRIQGDVEGYDFDPNSDHYNAPRRYLGNKVAGAANYVKKHPGKTLAKAVPFAPIAMNIAGAARSHVKSKEARTEENNPDASEAQKLMWKANKKSQQKNRNKKAVSSALGVVTTGLGGVVDLGAGGAAGDLAGEVFGETGNEIVDGALNEAFEIAGQFVDPTDVSDVASGLGMAVGESVSEDAGGAVVEDTEETVQDVRRNRKQPKTGQKPLIPKARLARGELNRDGGDTSLAHRSLLAKDLNYGKAVRKTVRGTLDTTLPEGAAPVFDSSAMTSTSSTNQQIETASDQFDLAKRNKSHMLAHLKESGQPQDSSNRITDGERTLKPSQFEEEQRNTKEASMHRLRKDLGYADDGSLMNKEQAEKMDDKLDNFKKKKWYES